MLNFDNNGLLTFSHDCEACDRFPNEDPSEPCIMCGFAHADIIKAENRVNAMNRCYMTYDEDFNNNDHIRKSNLHVSHLSIGGEGLDQLTLCDIDMNDDIRGLADLTDQVVDIYMIPTGIVYKESLNDDFDDEGGIYK